MQVIVHAKREREGERELNIMHTCKKAKQTPELHAMQPLMEGGQMKTHVPHWS